MKKLTDTNELAKIIRTRLISQSGINGNCVLNAQSLYGATLQQNAEVENVLDKTLLIPFNDNENAIVFDITNSMSDDDIVEETDTQLTVYSSFVCLCMFYGKDCTFKAPMVRARFLTQELLADFESEGVHIQSIENKEQINEFINEKLVTRQDIEIRFACELSISKSITYDNMTTASISEGWVHVK